MPEPDVEIASHESLWSRLSDCLGAQMGLHYPKERWGDLRRGIAAAARAFGMASAEACARRLLSAPLTRNQIEVLARCLTIGETYFFRDKRSFEILESQILPELLRARSGGERRLRIWSAGCCTGEEAYSVAILLARMIPDLERWNISILATDIDPDFLHKASLGIYGDWSFRDAPPGIKEGFFSETKQGRFEIVPRVKALVNFAYLNLAEDSYPSLANGTNAMDVILCRNVLMYFEPARARGVLQKLTRSLLEGGWLFVSPVEIPHVLLPQLVQLDFQGAIVHRRDGSPASPECTPAPVAGDLRLEDAPAALQPAEAPVQTPYQQAAAMALRARACANQGRLGEALQWCEKALEGDKLNAAWCYLRATILQEQGLAEDAATALKRALYLDQDNALAHFALGNLMRRQGKRNEADRHFRNALAILSGYAQEQVLPESEGITAGRLAAIIRSTVSSEARA
jgi:chemotaxis protein methyltransferase CheR